MTIKDEILKYGCPKSMLDLKEDIPLFWAKPVVYVSTENQEEKVLTYEAEQIDLRNIRDYPGRAFFPTAGEAVRYAYSKH
jgi:hypothetical protein